MVVLMTPDGKTTVGEFVPSTGAEGKSLFARAGDGKRLSLRDDGSVEWNDGDGQNEQGSVSGSFFVVAYEWQGWHGMIFPFGSC